jgi:hypothetical protein
MLNETEDGLCTCCGLLLDVRGACTVCDVDDVAIDPPHECDRRGKTVGSAEPTVVEQALRRLVEAALRRGVYDDYVPVRTR